MLVSAALMRGHTRTDEETDSGARHGWISRAGTELLLTQPAVSMQIKQLEDQIGLKLVDFVAKRMVLTEAGHELRGHAARFVDQTAELSTAMESFRGLERGLLRLTAVSTATYFLPRIIAAFSASYPGVRISLAVVNRDAALATLAENRTDLAITGQPPEDSLIASQHFMDNPLVVIASPKHQLASLKSIALTELADETVLLREQGSGTRAAVERHFSTRRSSRPSRPGSASASCPRKRSSWSWKRGGWWCCQYRAFPSCGNGMCCTATTDA